MLGWIHGVLLAAAPVPDCHATPVDLPPLSVARFEHRGKPRWLRFSEEGVCLAQRDGSESGAVLVDMGEMTIPAQIDVQTRALGEATPALEVQMLDAEGVVIARRGFNDFSSRGAGHRLTLFVNEAEGVPRYLLLRADPIWEARAGRQVRGRTHTAVVPVGPAVIAFNHGSEQESLVRYGLEGEFFVRWQPYQTRQLEEKKR